MNREVRMKKIYLALFLIFFISTANATFLSFIRGKPVKNSIFYLPIGSHTRDGHRKLKYFQLMGGVYKSFYLMTFINSFNDRVFSLGMERYIYQYRRLFLGYGVGAMYGYQGKLSTVHGIPFKNTFLFKYNLNPVIVGLLDFKITKHIQFSSVIAPLVIAIGFRFNF